MATRLLQSLQSEKGSSSHIRKGHETDFGGTPHPPGDELGHANNCFAEVGGREVKSGSLGGGGSRRSGLLHKSTRQDSISNPTRNVSGNPKGGELNALTRRDQCNVIVYFPIFPL